MTGRWIESRHPYGLALTSKVFHPVREGDDGGRARARRARRACRQEASPDPARGSCRCRCARRRAVRGSRARRAGLAQVRDPRRRPRAPGWNTLLVSAETVRVARFDPAARSHARSRRRRTTTQCRSDGRRGPRRVHHRKRLFLRSPFPTSERSEPMPPKFPQPRTIRSTPSEDQRPIRVDALHADPLVDAKRGHVLGPHEQADDGHVLEQAPAEVAHPLLRVAPVTRLRRGPRPAGAGSPTASTPRPRP